MCVDINDVMKCEKMQGSEYFTDILKLFPLLESSISVIM